MLDQVLGVILHAVLQSTAAGLWLEIPGSG